MKKERKIQSADREENGEPEPECDVEYADNEVNKEPPYFFDPWNNTYKRQAKA
ncbi:MAG: hypothetical protein JRF52_14345 [Deltaproteobacteria bacterium]|nr:hypothetical protein [Deltaproteobacteria bacterium]